MSLFRELYQYRELLKTNIKKDIRGRYKGSVLGVLWTFLNPLLQVFVYYIVFPYLMRGAAIPNYLVYLITGLIPWTFFLTTVTQGTTAIKANSGILKKVYFPRVILLVSQVCSGWVNFMISCVIILLFCLLFGVGFSIHLILIPVISLIEGLLILGIILILSAVNVYVQDVEYIVQFLLNMMFYGTPVLYSLNQFTNANPVLYGMIANNPVTILIDAYRDCFLYHIWPDWYALSIVFVVAFLTLLVGLYIFKKLERGFAEEL
ncbi:ABC transporter permease [Faecalibaculum rodentium]|uniref:ABC transporter permease n=1 Tax=Faecalibaculum rodentium TaxID=1702221 RepID=UPI0023F4FEBF|nr:ABC transporter permease [Faecalibaculum rodentium]